ncbi:putative P-loop containing nucleoside triphosphate hydrolase, leucine-rich repeat domain superfamily [Helianthus annuus]|nr:putative P-loop containing nucleoside triphosphate hydrolase, leucine-rich repeat domain superfamily [Helianthus annuus]
MENVVIEQVVNPVVESLMGHIKKHLGYASCSTRHVKNMEERKKVLENTSADVKKLMETNRINGKEIPTGVPGWLNDVEDLKKKVQSISGCEEIMISTALCGMGGIGKTTMMEQLKVDKNVTMLFDYIVKVVIGRDPNMQKIQNDIALCLGGEGLPEATQTSRADNLCRKFKTILENGKKKILVILDDVWEKVNLQDIGLISPLPEGVKLFLTSRNSNICKQIAADARSTFQEVKVDVLEEAEAKKFFFQITEVLEDDHDKYLTGCNIVKKCGCLPLAIKLIASTLKYQEDDDVWSDTLNCLNNNDLDDNVKEIVKISYEYIKDENKEIFLLCGLFPEDANIPIEDLMTYAWGLRLLKKVSTLKEARQRTYACVSKLINANLLIRSDHVGCVKLHDIVLAFVLGEVSKEYYACIINHGDVSNWDEDAIGESCKKISLTCRGLKHFPRDFKYPNLSLLQLMHGDMAFTFPEDFYKNMKNLKVISYFMMQYPLLPRSLECSTNLNTLCLHKCRVIIDECSFIGDLVNLEVLSFAHCAIHNLPATIANLRKLKLLDLTGCVDLHIDDGVLKNLVSLEELYMRVSEGKGVRFTNASFEELKMLSSQLRALEVEFVEKNTWPENFTFKKLDKFKISIGCLSEEKEWYTEKYCFEKTLKLVTKCSSQLQACKIDEIFPKAEHLHLQVNDMVGLEDISIRPYGQRSFCSLVELEISNCVNLIYLFPMSVASGLKKLERLIVFSCSVLKALVQDDGREINSAGDEMIKFEKLKFLSLRYLPELEILFNTENVVDLPQLVRLEVAGLPNFSSIYPDKNNSCSLLNSQVRIPEMKELRITSMENLKQIWGVSSEEDDNNNISMLREITVEGCNSLVNMFPSNPMRLLDHLEVLEVSRCRSIEVIFNIDMEFVSMLREIRVERCVSLVNLFPTNPMRLMDHLESLTIWECRSIEVIFNIDLECVGQVELLTNNTLRSIRVEDSKNLRKVWRIKGGENNYSSKLTCAFDALEEIEIYECKRFRNIFTPTNTNCKIHMPALTTMKILINWLVEEDLWMEERDDRYDGVDTVFGIESSPAGGRELVTTTNNQQPLLPNLQNLHLEGMHSISHVWKCSNWKKILILQNQSSFQNLTTIQIQRCKRIKYLFSPLMAKLLLNLKEIDIRWCEGMEEVVSNRDDKDEEMTTTYTTTTFFPHLHSLSFTHLNTLKRIGGGIHAKSSTTTHDQFESSHVTTIVPWSLCQYSREILIDQCDSLLEVFETLWVNNSAGGITSTSIDEGQSDTHNTSLVIPRPENINYMPRLVNLKKLVITSCNLLKHVFTFSTLGSLKHLEELMISECKAMEVIVKKENEDQRNVVDFPRLKSLELKDLPNLKGFFLGMNEFKWPLLEKVMIDYCPKMMVFTSGQSTALKLNYMHTSLGKYSLECGLNFHVTRNFHQWSFHNLIELHMERKSDVKYVIPSNELLHLEKLVRIKVNSCRDLEEVFEVENAMEEGLELEEVFEDAMEGRNSESQTQTLLVQIPNLTQIELRNLYSLKCIWNSNHHRRAVLQFPNLTTLLIIDCKSLKHVFTSSMVGSLQQLQDLHIRVCHNMEVIIKVELEEEEVSEVEDAMEEGLGLELLFREEEEVIAMKGINSGLVKSQSVVDIPNLMHVKLHYLKSLKYISRSNHHRILLKFPNLTTLSIHRCNSLEHVFTSSMVGSLQQLQDLHISNCLKMEVIIKVEEEESECDVTVKEIECLKSMRLERLNALEGFCLGEDNFSLPSLETLEIKECPKITIFSKGHVATPTLNVIDTSFGRRYIREDINHFIKTKLDEGLRF